MSNFERPHVKLLILDMDNTLYDWVSYFARAVDAMLQQASTILDVSEQRLRDDLREVHVHYGNTEHPFALLETRIVQLRFPDASPAERYRLLLDAFEAFGAERSKHLKLYPDVLQTLRVIKDSGCIIVGHTESTDVNIASRARRLGLTGLLKAIYAPTFTGPPHPFADHRESPASTPLRRLPEGTRKPAPAIVKQILTDENTSAESALYVGDSLQKDIQMARDAGVRTAWAKYGTVQDPALWRTLVSVSHWRPAAVAAAETSHGLQGSAIPDETLDRFGAILDRFGFGNRPSTQ